MGQSINMIYSVIKRTAVTVALCCAGLATIGSATTLQRLSFEELTDTSDLIVAGKVTRSWSAWDAGHRYIWTHYSVAVSATEKGVQAATVELAEPGGVVEGMGMTIAGSVAYKVGDEVLVFAQRMANGVIRTAGWGQGKYTIQADGKLRAEIASRAVEYVDLKTATTGIEPLRSLDGLTLQEARLRVASRLRSTGTANTGMVK
ncbi:MAG: hypothetical protein JWN34_151 [Bryobacterales bacterium]|nr:hypothetical protein [Bryobacterales bacterium]